MKTTERIAVWLYVTLLLAGGSLGVWALWVTHSTSGQEPLWQTVRRGGAGFAAVIVTVLFAAILISRGFRFLALPLFVISYVLVVATLDFSLSGYMKTLAPAISVEGPHATVVTVVFETLVFVCVVAAAWFSGRRAPRLASS